MGTGAELYAEESGQPGDVPAPQGVHQVRVQFEGYVNGSRSALEHPLRVR